MTYNFTSFVVAAKIVAIKINCHDFCRERKIFTQGLDLIFKLLAKECNSLL